MLWSPADGRESEAKALLAELLVELREEHAGEVPDRLCVEEVELHESLDGRFSGPVGVAHDFGDARLIFEAEALLGATGEKMQVTAHRPEEALGAVEAAKLRGGEKARLHEVGGALDALHIFADPVESVEVAEAALAVLDVGFDHVAAVAHADVAFVALGELGGNELGGRARYDVLAKSRDGPVEQLLIPPEPAGFQKGGSDRHVLLREGDELRDRANRMADLQLEVPEEMEHRLGRSRLIGSRRLRGQKHEVEVAVGRHLATTGAAKADQRQPFGRL